MRWPASRFADPGAKHRAISHFRRTIELENVPEAVRLRVSADTRYRLWINSVLVARGPLEVGGGYGNTTMPGWWYYDCVEVADVLCRGSNVIEAEVIGGPETWTDFSMGMCGFLLELWDASAGVVLVSTDRAWEVSSHHDGWRGSGLWDFGLLKRALQRWSPVRVLGHPDGQPWNLRPNRIGPLAEVAVFPGNIVIPFEEHRARVQSARGLLVDGETPTVIQPGAPLTFFAMFDRTWAGHLQIVADGPAGTRLEVSCQEIPGKDEHELMRQTVVLDGERAVFESPRYFSARCLRVCADIPPGGQPLRLFRLAINARTLPAEFLGRFESSDPKLDELWMTCRWTEQLCRQGIHLDSPHHQEPLGDHGDYLIEAAIDAYAFGEHSLTKADLERTQLYLAQHDTAMFHTSYRLLWVWMLHEYWMWTGDEHTVRHSLPQVRRLLEMFASYVGEEGLVSQAPDYMFIDWVEHGGFDLHHPPAALGMGSMTAFYVEALQRAADLEDALGDAMLAREHRRTAEQAAGAFRRVLWEERSGRFVDGVCGLSRVKPHRWLPADPATPLPGTTHVNVLAVLAGIAKPEDQARLMQMCLEPSAAPTPQPYFMHFVFEALERAGCYNALAPGLLARWYSLVRENPTSLKEMWDRGDYSHAWSGTPLVQCGRRILGVRPTVAGCREMEIRPHPCGLGFARGAVPTPRGLVGVSWRTVGAELHLEYFAPDGMIIKLNLDHLQREYGVFAKRTFPAQDSRKAAREFPRTM